MTKYTYEVWADLNATTLGGAYQIDYGQQALGGEGQISWAQIPYANWTQASTPTITTNANLGSANWYNPVVANWYGASLQPVQYVPDYLTSLPWIQTPETEGQRAERAKQEEAARLRRAAAQQRAEKLLFTILTPSQVRQYSDDGYFEQEVGGRIYRLHANSRSGNVVLLEGGKPVAKYCAHPSDAHITPIPDVLVSQLLMLRADEARFLQIANRTALL